MAAAVGSERNMQSMESMVLADAATQAAIAAAELVCSEAEAGQYSGVTHRTGLLRFMRARDDPLDSNEDPLLSPPVAGVLSPAGADSSSSGGSGRQQQQPGSSGSGWRVRQAVAPAGSSAGGVGLLSAAAAATSKESQQRQQQQQPVVAAASSAVAGQQQQQPRNSSGRGGGGMGQLVAELLAAQGKELPQQQQGEASPGSRPGTAGSAGGGAGAGPTAASGMSGGGAGRDVLEGLVKKLQRQGLTGDSWHARWVC